MRRKKKSQPAVVPRPRYWRAHTTALLPLFRLPKVDEEEMAINEAEKKRKKNGKERRKKLRNKEPRNRKQHFANIDETNRAARTADEVPRRTTTSAVS